jgi:hypothetical protein
VAAENLVFNKRSNRHRVENILKCSPDLDAHPVLALVVESIDSVQGCDFVIPTEQEKVARVFDFVA